MNLPLINNDDRGNSYLGWRTNNLIYAPDSAGVTSQQVTDWINGFFGQTCAIRVSVDHINLILPTSFESLSLPVTTSKARFQNNGNTICSANTDSVLGVGNRVNGSGSFSFYDLNAEKVTYAVLNNKSLNVCQIKRIGANLDSSSYAFLSIGWLNNPLYSGSTFPRNAYVLRLNSITSGNTAYKASAENTNSVQTFVVPTSLSANSIVNYPVSCQTATPGANTTELYLRDNTAVNKAIGSVPNVLKTTLNIPVGQIYQTEVDPDGSNNSYWKYLCAAKFGNESILMKVWATG